MSFAAYDHCAAPKSTPDYANTTYPTAGSMLMRVLYAAQLRPWLRHFPREQLLVLVRIMLYRTFAHGVRALVC